MEIQGPKFGNYDRQYLSVVRTDKPISVKPDIFREKDEEISAALRFADLVSLSPEAAALLRKIRKKQAKEGFAWSDLLQEDEEFAELFYALQELKEKLEKELPKRKERKPDLKLHLLASSVMQRPLGELLPQGNGQRPLPIRGSTERELLDRMLVIYPGRPAREQVIREVEVLGERVIRTCRNFGVRIIILGGHERLSKVQFRGMYLIGRGERTFDGRDWDSVRGIYDQSHRWIVLGEETLGHPGYSTARHEFAHAFDHSFSARNERKLPLSVELLNRFARERTGYVDEYAQTKPQEYFAECVEAFFRKDSRETLTQNDPLMFKYLEQMFD